ncbi:TetR/AcrR family transcriptional regulator [Massilia glaciei]|uniref:TetR/AcrR family transcriptional regulator n=1 Tax=Massilia glaciei TaxID=1524097 RepID=A0A2U2HID6_9BURK|nr:TetR/AcrR family transcriptional regulator [Massilia glaciei]PWF46119.1 TetR/AcrR family transcriptional regulator [Massilia glaciei]
MVRLAKYNEDGFIESAIRIAAQCGIGAVSMASIASNAGAPIGSLYHRFDSRNTVLARAWLKVRADFRAEVSCHWARGDTWRAVETLVQWCRDKPVYARFMLQSDEAPDFGELSAPLREELEADQAELDAAFTRCVQTLPPGADDAGHVLRFVLIGAPVAMVKPFLNQDLPIPASINAVLRSSHDAVCTWARKAA